MDALIASRKPNFASIAELAGVSPSTVDRVLNGRGSVSERAHRKVVTAARQLGVQRLLPAVVRGFYRFDLVRTFDAAGVGYFPRLERAFKRAAEQLDRPVQLHSTVWPAHSEQRLATFIRDSQSRRDGLIVIAHDSDVLRAAVADAVAADRPTVLLNCAMSDVAGAPYIGIDNRAAGRTSAQLLGAMCGAQGRVLMLSNSLSYQDHRQRSEGFLDVMAREFPAMQVEGPVDIGDDPYRARQALSRALAGQRLAALYNTGAGSRGLAEILGLLPAHQRPLWLTHEACEEHIALLQQGVMTMVIDQDPDAQALCALQALLHRHHDGPAPASLQPMFRIVTRENADLYRAVA